YNASTGEIRVFAQDVTSGATALEASIRKDVTWGNVVYGMDSSGAPIPQFTSVAFGSLTVDGGPIAAALTVDTVDDLYNGANLLVHTTKFGAPGAGFRLLFVAAQ